MGSHESPLFCIYTGELVTEGGWLSCGRVADAGTVGGWWIALIVHVVDVAVAVVVVLIVIGMQLMLSVLMPLPLFSEILILAAHVSPPPSLHFLRRWGCLEIDVFLKSFMVLQNSLDPPSSPTNVGF